MGHNKHQSLELEEQKQLTSTASYDTISILASRDASAVAR
jgi:hypothetical protein